MDAPGEFQVAQGRIRLELVQQPQVNFIYVRLFHRSIIDGIFVRINGFMELLIVYVTFLSACFF